MAANADLPLRAKQANQINQVSAVYHESLEFSPLSGMVRELYYQRISYFMRYTSIQPMHKQKNKVRTTSLLVALLVGLPFATHARTYDFTPGSADIVGKLTELNATATSSLTQIAIDQKVGFDALYSANKRFATDQIPAGSTLTLPLQYILPDVKREGIVINLPELRLYFFHPDKERVSIYPIGIGRSGWDTPLMVSAVSSIRKNPTWTPPASIRKAYAADGVSLPISIPPGPDNPLGSYAMRLGSTNILIHGNASPKGVGRRVSSGCIRLYEADIKELAGWVVPGTPVNIINQPIKWARQADNDFIEAHQPLAKIVIASGETELNSSSDGAHAKQRKYVLHSGFRRAERVAGSDARKNAEQFAHQLQSSRQLFTGIPQRVVVKNR